MNRRNFIIQSGSALAFLHLLGCSELLRRRPNSQQEIGVFWHGTRPGPEVLLPLTSSHIVFLDPHKKSYEVYEIPITVHSMLQNPERSHEIFLISKWSKEVALFDRRSNTITKIIKRPDHLRVYGHAAWDDEQQGFWFTEHDYINEKGYLTFCDSKLNVSRRIESAGGTPHEIRKHKGLYYVANSIGIKSLVPSLAVFDLKSGELVNRVEIPKLDKKGIITHMCFAENDDRIFIGGHRTDSAGSVMVEVKNNQPRLIEPQHELFSGESFSLMHNPMENILSWVNPFSGGLFSWDLNQDKLLNVKNENFINGQLTFDGEVLTSTKADSSIYEDKKKILGITPPAQGTWGVHMHVLNKT